MYRRHSIDCRVRKLTQGGLRDWAAAEAKLRSIGASPTVAMTHIAIQEALNGKVVDWMEKVSEEDYQNQK